MEEIVPQETRMPLLCGCNFCSNKKNLKVQHLFQILYRHIMRRKHNVLVAFRDSIKLDAGSQPSSECEPGPGQAATASVFAKKCNPACCHCPRLFQSVILLLAQTSISLGSSVGLELLPVIAKQQRCQNYFF